MDSQFQDGTTSELQVLGMDKSKNEVERAQCKKRCLSKIKIIWSFLSFLISVADVTVIIWLSYLHFSHSQDILAWLMLLPILLNFIGIFTFLSNEAERKEMESLGCQRTKHFMFFPVIGPAFSSLRLFSYAFEEEDVEKYERLESLLMKMKQYESYFRAAPEAFIQITFRIVSWSNNAEWHSEERWTTVCIVLCTFALAESNIYASVKPAYYKLFNYTSDKDAWKVDDITIPWRVGLAFFNYCSIGSRLFTDAIFRATACFYFEKHDIQFGEVIILTFIFQFVGRAITRAIYQNTLMFYTFDKKKTANNTNNIKDHQEKGSSNEKETIAINTIKNTKKLSSLSKYPAGYIPVQEDLTGVYGAFTYSWRCLFMSFDFQDWVDSIVFFWFYVENIIFIICSYAVIYVSDYDLSDKNVYYIYTAAAFGGMILAILLKYGLIYAWKRKKAKQVAMTKF